MHYEKQGLKYKLFLGDKNIAFRMYPDGLYSQMEGFTKNFSIGILSSGFITTLLTFVWITSITGTIIRIAMEIASGNMLNAYIAIGLYCIIVIQLIFYSMKIGDFKPYLMPLYPIALIWFMIVILYSFVRKLFFRTAKWKNRKIKI